MLAMRKYLAFFRLRFSMGLQYRTADLAGIATQYLCCALCVGAVLSAAVYIGKEQ